MSKHILKTRAEFEAVFLAYCAESGTTAADQYSGNNREKTWED
jgi:hypothetical protein